MPVFSLPTSQLLGALQLLQQARTNLQGTNETIANQDSKSQVGGFPGIRVNPLELRKIGTLYDKSRLQAKLLEKDVVTLHQVVLDSKASVYEQVEQVEVKLAGAHLTVRAIADVVRQTQMELAAEQSASSLLRQEIRGLQEESRSLREQRQNDHKKLRSAQVLIAMLRVQTSAATAERTSMRGELQRASEAQCESQSQVGSSLTQQLMV